MNDDFTKFKYLNMQVDESRSIFADSVQEAGAGAGGTRDAWVDVCTEVLGLSQPFTRLNVKGLLRITIQTGVLIETLAVLGAKMRWASCSIFSTQHHAAAAIAKAGTSTVFVWKGKTLPDYWSVHRAIDVRS